MYGEAQLILDLTHTQEYGEPANTWPFQRRIDHENPIILRVSRNSAVALMSQKKKPMYGEAQLILDLIHTQEYGEPTSTWRLQRRIDHENPIILRVSRNSAVFPSWSEPDPSKRRTFC